MTSHSDDRAVRRAVFILLLAAGAMAHESFATPVLLEDSVASVAESAGDEDSPGAPLKPKRRVAAVDPSALPSPMVLDEIRIDDAAPGRRPGMIGTPSNPLSAGPGAPGTYGGTFGQGETLREQLLRDFRSAASYPGAEQAGVSDQQRRDSVQQLANPAQVMLRDAIDNSLRLIRETIVDEIDTVSYSVIGIDFFFTLGGGFRPQLGNAEYWSAMPQVQLFDAVHADTSARTPVPEHAQGGASLGGGGGGSGGGGNPMDIPAAVPPDHPGPLLLQKIRDFVTDATTIVVALACLLAWLSYELTTSIRERRRLRRIRRRRARARR